MKTSIALLLTLTLFFKVVANDGFYISISNPKEMHTSVENGHLVTRRPIQKVPVEWVRLTINPEREYPFQVEFKIPITIGRRDFYSLIIDGEIPEYDVPTSHSIAPKSEGINEDGTIIRYSCENEAVAKDIETRLNEMYGLGPQGDRMS
jgi:hypothetical protein